MSLRGVHLFLLNANSATKQSILVTIQIVFSATIYDKNGHINNNILYVALLYIDNKTIIIN